MKKETCCKFLLLLCIKMSEKTYYKKQRYDTKWSKKIIIKVIKKD